MKGNRHPRVSYKSNHPGHLIATAALHVAAATRSLHRAAEHREIRPPTATDATIARLHISNALSHLQDAHYNITQAHAAHRRSRPAP